jgi:iron complex transport system substrate-binding protein
VCGDESGATVKGFLARTLLGLLGGGLALACDGGAGAPGAERFPRVVSGRFPVRLEHGGEPLELTAPPTRILPTNAAWVDFVSLLTGPERLVALPAEAFGYSRLAANEPGWAALPPFQTFEGERILALGPDLVLAHSWQNAETIAGLRRSGLPVLVVPVPESWAEVLATLELVGVVLGEPERARASVTELERRRAALAARAAPFAGMRALTYTNLGAGGWTSAAGTTGEILLELAGLTCAATEAGLRGDVPADQERLLALAPDVFVVGRPDRSESSPPSAEFLLAQPALRELEAVRAQRIVALSPAHFTSASPELLRGAELLVEELERLAAH